MNTRLTLAMVTPPRMPLRTLSEPLRPIVKKQIFNAVILVFRQNNRVAARTEPRPYLQPVKVVVRLFVECDAGVVAGCEVAGGLAAVGRIGLSLAGRPRAVPANDAADFAGREFDESFHVGLQKKRARASNEEKPPGGLPFAVAASEKKADRHCKRQQKTRRPKACGYEKAARGGGGLVCSILIDRLSIAADLLQSVQLTI